MDMFHERKIAHMPTSTIGKAVVAVDEESVWNLIVLLGGVSSGRQPRLTLETA